MMVQDLIRDAAEMAQVAQGRADARSIARTVIYDSYAVVAMTRVREAARRWKVPVINRFLRFAQMTVFGIEIGKDVTLGHGVYLVHTLGTVIGGNARIGNRVKFMGNNTVGTAKDNGYPVIDDDVIVGCGARILGPIHVGAGAVIGANAVVLSDVPPGSIAVGIPAVIRRRADGQTEQADPTASMSVGTGVGTA